MAITERGWWSLAMSFVDDDGAVSRFAVNIKDVDIGEDFAYFQVYAEAVVTAIVELTDAALLGYSLTKEFYEADAEARVGAEGSDVENKGVFLLDVSGGFKGSLSVPSILESKLVASGALAGIQINLDDAEVSAFVDLLVEDYDANPGGAGGTVHACDSRGDSYIRVADAYKQNRASFKSRGRRG